VEAILQDLHKVAILESVHKLAQFLSADPRVAKDVYPNFSGDPTQHGFHDFGLRWLKIDY